MARVHSSKLVSRNGLSALKPAILTTTSTPPSSLRADFTHPATAASSVTSHFSATTLTPSLRASSATWFNSFIFALVQMARFAPSPANASAAALPRLRLAPVISTFLPLSPVSIKTSGAALSGGNDKGSGYSRDMQALWTASDRLWRHRRNNSYGDSREFPGFGCEPHPNRGRPGPRDANGIG